MGTCFRRLAWGRRGCRAGFFLFVKAMDSDRDGIVDYVEEFRLRSNRLAADTKGDGIGDGVMVATGWSPRDDPAV